MPAFLITSGTLKKWSRKVIKTDKGWYIWMFKGMYTPPTQTQVSSQPSRIPGAQLPGGQPLMILIPIIVVSQVWPDMQGGVHLYGDLSYPTQHVNYSYWKDGQILVDGQTTPGDLPYGDSQPDGQNNLHLFRQAQVPIPGEIVNGIYHRCLTNNLTWTEEQVISAFQDTSPPLLKASDQVSQVALAWQESAGNRVHVAIFEDCTPIRQAVIILPQENPWGLESVSMSHFPQ